MVRGQAGTNPGMPMSSPGHGVGPAHVWIEITACATKCSLVSEQAGRLSRLLAVSSWKPAGQSFHTRASIGSSMPSWRVRPGSTHLPQMLRLVTTPKTLYQPLLDSSIAGERQLHHAPPFAQADHSYDQDSWPLLDTYDGYSASIQLPSRSATRPGRTVAGAASSDLHPFISLSADPNSSNGPKTARSRYPPRTDRTPGH